MSEICNQDSCDLNALYSGKCSLHCDKGDYQQDKMSGKLSDFYDELSNYILNEIPEEVIKSLESNVQIDEKKSSSDLPLLQQFLPQLEKSRTFKKITIYLQNIKFPERDPRDTFDYFKVLQLFKGLHFDSSHIGLSSLNLPNIQLFFEDCIFTNSWSIHSFLIIEDVVGQALFQSCVFQREVISSSQENSRDILKLESHLFTDCTFRKQVALYRGTYQKSIFKNSKDYHQKISNLHLVNCELKDRFILNNSDIDLLKIEDMEFEGKVELKDNIIQIAFITNVNFKALFDAYKTKFKQFKVSRSIFDDFSGFEKCEFGCKDDLGNEKVEFEYVTFLNFTNFRKAKFYNGLDFEHTNLKESPNFLNAKINENNTNRETFRIIKHSFDKIGNQIEANKYFAFEMKKYKEELENQRGYSAERAVFSINKFISNFGESIVKPLFLMISIAIIYYLLILGYESNCLYKIYEPMNEHISKFAISLNTFAKGIPPYGRFLKEGMEFITLAYHIAFITFTWHFLVAIKRCTKR